MQKTIELVQSTPTLFALAIIVAAVLLAVIVDLIATRVLLRLTRKTHTDLDDEIVASLRRPLFFSVLFVGIALAINRFKPPESLNQKIEMVLLTTAILLWTLGGMRIVRTILDIIASRAGEHKYVQAQTVPLFEIAAKTLIFGGAAYGILLVWEVDVTAWLASAGILGIAVGFAAKDTLANLFSGIFILADAPYKLGDFIVLDSGERGRVTDIGMRSTRLLTRDDIQIIVPNAAIANAKIINESGGPHVKERVRVNVGVAYGSDIDHVRKVLMDIAEKSKYLASNPAPRVRFRSFGDSSLNFQLMGWIDEPVLRGRSLDELYTAVYNRFNEEKIVIPFPQHDVHLSKN